MEADAGQYGETLLSRHMSRKIALIKDNETKRKYLMSDDVRQKAQELFFTEDEQHRFYLLDNRDGSIEEIQETIEELVVACGCKIIILDPIQDILDGLSNDEQAVFMKWCKGLIKSHNVTLILINHVRKSASGSSGSSNGSTFSEEEIQGSSTIIKSASVNILLSRDKYSEDEVERNTTKVLISKNRICGLTGPAGEVYYENETHTLHNKEDYFTN
jgi:replicative DNA helicase